MLGLHHRRQPSVKLGRIYFTFHSFVCFVAKVAAALLLLWTYRILSAEWRTIEPWLRFKPEPPQGGALWNDGRCLSVSPSVCRVPRPNSRTERLRKPKIGRMEVHHTGKPGTYLHVKRSKVKVTGSQNVKALLLIHTYITFFITP